MDIVFARTRWDYPSYTDYWALVKLSGFEVCYVDQVDFSKEILYIVSPINGEWEPYRDACRDVEYRARVAAWILERPSGTNGVAVFRERSQELLDKWYFDEIWLSDRHLHSLMRDERIRFVVLGSHKELGTLDKLPQRWDFIHLSHLTHRRDKLYKELQDNGISVAENCWGEERHERLCSSRFMLNVHQDGAGILEPLRFALGAAYGLPILTEKCHDSYPYNRGGNRHNVCEVLYENIIQTAIDMAKGDYEGWQAMGRRCRHLMATILTIMQSPVLPDGASLFQPP